MRSPRRFLPTRPGSDVRPASPTESARGFQRVPAPVASFSRAGATVNEPRISNGRGPDPIVRWNEYVLPAESGFAVSSLPRVGAAGPPGETGAGPEGSG